MFTCSQREYEKWKPGRKQIPLNEFTRLLHILVNNRKDVMNDTPSNLGFRINDDDSRQIYRLLVDLADEINWRDDRGKSSRGGFLRAFLAEILLGKGTSIVSHLDLSHLQIVSSKSNPSATIELEQIQNQLTEIRSLVESTKQGIPKLATAALSQFGDVQLDDARRPVNQILQDNSQKINQ